MFVTRTLQAETVPDLLPVCQHIGFIRADLWRRYGALANRGKNVSEIRAEIVERGYYNHIPIDGTIRNETIKDVVNDILRYKAAAKQKVRQDIAARTADPEERKRLYTLLKNDAWLSDSFLHRRMRKRFKHGVSQVRHQFVVRSDRHTEEVIDGRLVITIKIAKKYGNAIRLVTTTNGKDVDLTGSNLRILVKGDVTEIHSAYEKPAGRPHGEQALGIDKGYSEAFVDSDGEAHGETFGRILTDYSDRVAATGQGRNQLHALEKKHRAAGHTAKADRIKHHNLGRKKLLARRDRTRRQLRNCGLSIRPCRSG